MVVLPHYANERLTQYSNVFTHRKLYVINVVPQPVLYRVLNDSKTRNNKIKLGHASTLRIICHSKHTVFTKNAIKTHSC